MANSRRKILKVFTSYQRSDRNAIVIIAVLLLLLVTANSVLKNIQWNSNTDFTEIKNMIENWEKSEVEKKVNQVLFNFDPNRISELALDSLSIPDYVKQNLLNYRKAGGKYKTAADVRKLYGMTDSIFSLIENNIHITRENRAKAVVKTTAPIEPTGFFDPNSTTASELHSFGFSAYQAKNLISYQQKGGVFRSASDILKIYGIDSSFYHNVVKFIKIEEVDLNVTEIPEKILIVELNSADSSDLVQLNGIGPVYAKRIIKYRTLLGGFYATTQIKEVYNFPEETFDKIQNNICVDTLQIIRLRINFAEFKELIKHPYLNKEQVIALTCNRERTGAYTNVKELRIVKGFDFETITKISPYITCR